MTDGTSTDHDWGRRLQLLLERHLGPGGHALLRTGSLPAPDWLATPQQELLTLTSGVVLRDDIGPGEVRRPLSR